jgi:anti-sigma factor RsiW
MMLTCAELVGLVTDYLENNLDAAETQRFEAHISICPPCRGYLAQMRETKAQVGRLTEESLPEPMQAHLLDAFRQWKQKT